MKTCTKCRETKPLIEFSRKSRNKDGLGSNCKLCHNNRQRGYRKANRDKILERKREYYEANRDKILICKREYREANWDARREYHEANRDKILEYHRLYHEDNRDKILERKREYYEAVSTQISARRRGEQRTSARNATHHHQPWSAAEDLIAGRADLTLKEVAHMLGRSISSVTTRRHRIRSRANSTIETEAGAV